MAQVKVDCGDAFKGYVAQVTDGRYAKTEGQRLAGLHRAALRAYEACQAGDGQLAKVLFEKLPDPGDQTGPGPFNPNLPQ
jgi:hypothetical protein